MASVEGLKLRRVHLGRFHYGWSLGISYYHNEYGARHISVGLIWRYLVLRLSQPTGHDDG